MWGPSEASGLLTSLTCIWASSSGTCCGGGPSQSYHQPQGQVLGLTIFGCHICTGARAGSLLSPGAATHHSSIRYNGISPSAMGSISSWDAYTTAAQVGEHQAFAGYIAMQQKEKYSRHLSLVAMLKAPKQCMVGGKANKTAGLSLGAVSAKQACCYTSSPLLCLFLRLKYECW